MEQEIDELDEANQKLQIDKDELLNHNQDLAASL
jgi:hypothetical protein